MVSFSTNTSYSFSPSITTSHFDSLFHTLMVILIFFNNIITIILESSLWIVAHCLDHLELLGCLSLMDNLVNTLSPKIFFLPSFREFNRIDLCNQWIRSTQQNFLEHTSKNYHRYYWLDDNIFFYKHSVGF